MNTCYLPRIIAFVMLLTLSLQMRATHIVGGELFYTCLGDDQYEITLTIFRDCYNGNPQAFFDDPAYIGIYNNGLLIDSLEMPFDPLVNDTLNPVLANPCLTVPPDVCVHTTTYIDTFTLSPIAGGYDLVYQRCCRNVTIVNIVDPLDSGATFGVSISETALQECNTSAQFSAWPPIFICVGEPIDFDQSAFDPDGDSIVHRLCTPLLGATPDAPYPQPWAQTVPGPVNWVSPSYGVTNMLNSDPSGDVLTIDPVTGFLTGTPDIVGQFVVGICVEEYRDGQLISTTRRDFQFNVGICGQTISSFFTPEVVCSNALTVCADNLSFNATEFDWYFNDPAYPDSVVTDVSPCFTYSDTGAYQIMLVAQPGDPCVDTFMIDVLLNYESLGVGFDFEFTECTDTMIIQATDLSIDTISAPANWDWTITDQNGVVVATSTEQNPMLAVGASGEVTMQLVVTAENGCIDSLEETFMVNVIDEELFPDTIVFCEMDSVQLNATSTMDYVYFWTPPFDLSDVNAPSPWASPDETTTYSAIISDSIGFCEVIWDVTVIVPPPLDLIMPPDMTTCEANVELIGISEQGVDFTWSLDAEFNSIFDTLPNTIVTPFGEITYYLEVVDAYRCSIIDSVTIIGNGVNIETDAQPIICDGETTEVNVFNLDFEDMLTYSWSPGLYVLDGINNDTATVQPPGPGTYPFYITAENQYGCTSIDSVLVAVLDTTSQSAFVSEQQCSGYSVQFTNTSINAPYLIWNFGDPTNPMATSTDINPEYTYPGPGVYTVTLAVNADVNCPDTFAVDIEVFEPEIVVDFGWAYDACTDSTLIFFTDSSTNLQSNIVAWQWVFSNGDTSVLENPILEVHGDQILQVELTIFSDDGCDDVMTIDIPINLFDLDLQDSIVACPGTQVALNPGGNTDYVYQWSPGIGLNQTDIANPLANPAQTTTYDVIINDPSIDTCQLTRKVTVIVPPLIDLEVSDDAATCDSEIQLFANSPQAVEYIWSNVPSFNSVIGYDSIITTLPGNLTKYFVRAIDEFGCFKEDTIFISSQSVKVDVPDYDLCFGDTLQITPINNDINDVLTFFWTPESEIITDNEVANILVSPEETQTYTTFVSNQYGCLDTLESTVNIFNYIPLLNAMADPDTIFAGESSQLSATDSINYSYTWTPASTLDDPTISNPLATPTETTTYEVRIQNEDGCPNTATVRVIVVDIICEEPFVFFPNAFTPNGDGENDFLKVYGNYIEEVHWVIYNRWGQKVFEANSVNDEWDGSFNGERLHTDVFGYYLEVRCVGGEEYFTKGNVTLLK